MLTIIIRSQITLILVLPYIHIGGEVAKIVMYFSKTENFVCNIRLKIFIASIKFH